jgi:hypothetical protein
MVFSSSSYVIAGNSSKIFWRIFFVFEINFNSQCIHQIGFMECVADLPYIKFPPYFVHFFLNKFPNI